MLGFKIYDLSPYDFFSIEKELENIEVSKEAYDILVPKSIFHRYLIRDLNYKAANILKQEALSYGAELSISYKTFTMEAKNTDVLLTATEYQLVKIINKLKFQPFQSLKKLSNDLKTILKNKKNKEDYITIGNKKFYWKKNKYVMGIINATPDSFFPDSRVNEKNLAKIVESMIKNGVDILDVGGESTRPGSDRVPLEEEIKRVRAIISFIKKNFKIPVSIDTYKSDVAKIAFDLGADMLNDISALKFDSKMLDIIKEYKVPVCIMHIKGEPKNMQKNPQYKNLINEVYDYFYERIKFLTENGVDENKIIIDPGIGFGKRLEDNLRLIKYINYFSTFGLPILFGGSRKSFIGMILNKEVEDRLYGSLSAHLLSSIFGASFVRVHDVSEMNEVLKIFNSTKEVERFES